MAPSKRQSERAGAAATLLELSAQLWDDVCCKPTPAALGDVLRDDLHIREILDKMRALQLNAAHSQAPRAEAVSALLAWATVMGISWDGLRLQQVPDVDGQYGLFVDAPLQAGQLVVTVPRKAMMTWDDVRLADYMKQAMENDPMLVQMENVALALFLLCERQRGGASPWAAYISSLPSSHDTPLYLSHEAVKRVASASPTLGIYRVWDCPLAENVLRMFRSVARQFVYFHAMLGVGGRDNSARRNWLRDSPLTLTNFTFDQYLWAVATVSSRINLVPSDSIKNGEKPAMVPALIPLVDMANHSWQSRSMLELEPTSGAAELRAGRAYTGGEQLFIYYGERSAHEFLLHNGFLPPGAPLHLPVRLGLSKGDKQYEKRVQYLAALDLRPHEMFLLSADCDPVVPQKMWHFAKVFVAPVLENKLELNDKDNERKSWRYLKTRFSLMRIPYKKVFDDPDLLRDTPILSLLGIEEKLLAQAEAFCDVMAGAPA